MPHTPVPADSGQHSPEADSAEQFDKLTASIQVNQSVLMVRLVIFLLTVAFVLGLVYLGCDPYLALTGGGTLLAAAIKLTSPDRGRK